MIILDTNVVSEMMRAAPDMRALKRLEEFAPETVFVTTITIQELCYGATRVRMTARYAPLMKSISDLHQVRFRGRVLDYDTAAAETGGRLQAEQKMRGEMVDYGDLQIAAIALTRNFVIATRNTKDFLHTGAKIFNPWDQA